MNVDASNAYGAVLHELDLIALTEHPESRLLARDPASWSEPERHAAWVLRLFEALDPPHYGDQGQALLELLARAPPEQCRATAAALVAIGAVELLALLRRIHRALGFGIDTPATAMRGQQIAVLDAHQCERLEQIAYRFIDVQAVARLQLWRYLALHASQVCGWRPGLPTDARPDARAAATEPVLQPPRQAPGSGSLAVFLLEVPYDPRDRSWQALLEAWRERCLAAGLPSGPSLELGPLRQPRPAPAGWSASPSATRQPEALAARERLLTPRLQELARERHWGLLTQLRTLPGELCCWVSADPLLAREFERLVHEPRFAALLLGSWLGIDEFEAHAGGLQFWETGDYGAVALVAAAADGVPPWLVLEFGEREWLGNWWRSAAARLPCAAWRLLHDRQGGRLVRAVYRGTDAAAFLQLWSRLGDDRNRALASASGSVSAEVLLDALSGTDRGATPRDLLRLSQACGWGYMHYWGGGADEHGALFHARDPAFTRRVSACIRDRAAAGWQAGAHW